MPFLSYDICALGNAIVDIIADVPEIFLRQHHIKPDGMTLVDHAHITLIRKSLTSARVVRAGGAAGNVVAGIASFGGKAAFLGKTAFDEIGHLFSDDLQKLGVHFPTATARKEGIATGLCLSLVSSGAHRSMCTYLGASAEFGAHDLDPESIRAASVIYLEGYMLDSPCTRHALHGAADMARKAGRKVALALCNPGCVERNRADFLELIRARTDILFANEKELMTLYKTFNLDQAIAEVKGHVETAVITRGEKGSIVVTSSRQIFVAAEPAARLVDKTGAGDLYAAGFLYGLARDFDLNWCGKLGAIAAAEVISHYGPRPEQSLAMLAKEKGVML